MVDTMIEQEAKQRDAHIEQKVAADLAAKYASEDTAAYDELIAQGQAVLDAIAKSGPADESAEERLAVAIQQDVGGLQKASRRYFDDLKAREEELDERRAELKDAELEREDQELELKKHENDVTRQLDELKKLVEEISSTEQEIESVRAEVLNLVKNGDTAGMRRAEQKRARLEKDLKPLTNPNDEFKKRWSALLGPWGDLNGAARKKLRDAQETEAAAKATVEALEKELEERKSGFASYVLEAHAAIVEESGSGKSRQPKGAPQSKGD